MSKNSALSSSSPGTIYFGSKIIMDTLENSRNQSTGSFASMSTLILT